MKSLNFKMSVCGSGLVNKSAGFSAPAIWNSSIFSFSSSSRTKWYLILICLVLQSIALLVAMNIAAWLSAQRGVPFVGEKLISCANDLSHAHCFAVSESSIYSASPTEVATTFWRLHIHVMAQFAIMKMLPDVECLSSLFSPQSESEKPIRPACESPSYLSLSSLVPTRYLNTYLA